MNVEAKLYLYRTGWVDGSAFNPSMQDNEDYLQGYKDGREAFVAAMKAKREELQLLYPPEACERCGHGGRFLNLDFDGRRKCGPCLGVQVAGQAPADGCVPYPVIRR